MRIIDLSQKEDFLFIAVICWLLAIFIFVASLCEARDFWKSCCFQEAVFCVLTVADEGIYPVRFVSGKLNGIPHVEAQVCKNGEWLYLYQANIRTAKVKKNQSIFGFEVIKTYTVDEYFAARSLRWNQVNIKQYMMMKEVSQ